MKQLAATGVALCLLPAALWCGQAKTSQPTLWRYAHPNARILAGIEYQRISSSPLATKIWEEAKLAGFSATSMRAASVLAEMERMFISSPGNPPGGVEDGSLVVAVQGRFDLAELKRLAISSGEVSKMYRTVELMVPRKTSEKSSRCVALVSPQIILFGDQDSVQAAIDAWAAADPAQASSSLFHRAAELSAAHDIWAVSEVSPSELAGSQKPGPAQMLEKVRSFEAGIGLQSGLAARLSLYTDSDETARMMATGLQALLSMAVSSQTDNPQIAELANRLEIGNDGETVRLAISVNQAELDRGVEQLREASRGAIQERLGAQASIRRSMETPQAAPLLPAEPEGPKVIRIFGAEGGPREVPFPEH